MLKRLLILTVLLAPVLALAQRAADFDSQAENEIATLINQERAQRGMGPVRIDDRLTRAARLHTELMIEKHELSHRLIDEPVLSARLADTGVEFEVAGENVAYDATAPHAHDEFMHSPGHKANILNPKFNAVGLGVMHSGNLIWVTEDFAEKMGVTSASEAASIVMNKYGELRKAAGSPPATEHTMPTLGRVACEMAHKDRVDTQAARGDIPNVRGVMAWTAADPAKLPAQVKKLADDRAATTYSLGVCFASSSSYPSKVFWMVIAVY